MELKFDQDVDRRKTKDKPCHVSNLLSAEVPSEPPGINPFIWNTYIQANTSLSPYQLLLHSMECDSRASEEYPQREGEENRSKLPVEISTDPEERQAFLNTSSLLCPGIAFPCGHHEGCLPEQWEKYRECSSRKREAFREIWLSKYICGWKTRALTVGDQHGITAFCGTIYFRQDEERKSPKSCSSSLLVPT